MADFRHPLGKALHLISQVAGLSVLAPSRCLALTICIFTSSLSAVAGAGAEPTIHPENRAHSGIVIGFVGGFVRHDDARHGPVRLAQRIRQTSPPDTYVEVFENRHRKGALKKILRLLDANEDGNVSEDEKSRARIVLFGHSWGAAAAVLLARDLERESIPVMMTAQVDSVAKFWQQDSVIPPNVAEAVNFYQPHGLVHGRREIKAADPSRTQVLGNYAVDYRRNPVHCSAGASWFDHLTPSHAQSECDPYVWSKIEDLVRQRIGPQRDTSAMVQSAPSASNQ